MVTRREFLAWGAATGAVAASGVVIPIAVASRGSAPTPGTPVPDGADDSPDPVEPAAVPAEVTLYPRVNVASLSALRVGDTVAFEYPTKGTGAALFRLGRPAAGGIGPDGDIVAFNTDCTHMGCPLSGGLNVEHGVLGPCGCHFTTFDLTHRGQVVIGQATENLPQIVLDLDGDDVVAVGTLGLVYGFRDNLADVLLVEGL